MIEGGGGNPSPFFILDDMGESKIIKAVNTNKKNLEKKENKEEGVSIESQARLAEILSDSPRLVSLNGTEWEVRALRMVRSGLSLRRLLRSTRRRTPQWETS